MLIYLSPLMPPFFLIAPVAKPKSGALSVISNDSATKVRLISCCRSFAYPLKNILTGFTLLMCGKTPYLTASYFAKVPNILPQIGKLLFTTKLSSTNMNYQQLTKGNRYQIFALLEQEISVVNFVRTLNCHRVTITS